MIHGLLIIKHRPESEHPSGRLGEKEKSSLGQDRILRKSNINMADNNLLGFHHVLKPTKYVATKQHYAKWFLLTSIP